VWHWDGGQAETGGRGGPADFDGAGEVWNRTTQSARAHASLLVRPGTDQRDLFSFAYITQFSPWWGAPWLPGRGARQRTPISRGPHRTLLGRHNSQVRQWAKGELRRMSRSPTRPHLCCAPRNCENTAILLLCLLFTAHLWKQRFSHVLPMIQLKQSLSPQSHLWCLTKCQLLLRGLLLPCDFQ